MIETLPPTRQERWELIKQIAVLYREPKKNSLTKFASAEECQIQLGIQLPAALLEWYAVASEISDLWTGQETLVEPQALRLQKEGLVIVIENQACWECFITMDNMTESDPPVMGYSLGSSPQSVSPAVSIFALQFLLYETFLSGRHSYYGGPYGVEGKQRGYLQEQFKKCDLPDLTLWEKIEFYERNDVFLMLMWDSMYEDYAYWAIAAQSAESYRTTLKEFQALGFSFEDADSSQIALY
jgi:hypothetical protein